MTMRPRITLHGFTTDDLLALPRVEFEALVFCGEPLVFRTGTAEVLGQLDVSGDTVVVDILAIDRGGEALLPSLARLVRRYARQAGLAAIAWRFHAAARPRPSRKLLRVLQRRRFQVQHVPGIGPCHVKVAFVTPRPVPVEPLPS
jgi:hypothetical protein